MTTSTCLIICAMLAALMLSEAQAVYLPKRVQPYIPRDRADRIGEPRKRPFCNAFTGCGRKRSNLPALTPTGEEINDSVGSLVELNAEPAVEELSRQIMSEAKLWEAIQEANRLRQQQFMDEQEDGVGVPARSATANCALPPCYI